MLMTDGPFVEAEHIGGFSLIRAADLALPRVGPQAGAARRCQSKCVGAGRCDRGA